MTACNRVLGLVCLVAMIASCGDAEDKDKDDESEAKTLSLSVDSGFQTKFGYQAFRQLGASVRASDASVSGAQQEITVTFAATPKDTGGKVTLYSDETLQTEANTVKIKQGAAGADIYFIADALAGDSVTVVASSEGYPDSDPLVVPITQSILRLKNPATTPGEITAAFCSELEVAIVTRDTLESATADVDVEVTPTVTATPSAASAELFKDDQCLTSVGSDPLKLLKGSAPLYVKDTSVGNTLTIKVTAPGFPAVEALTLNTVPAEL